MVITIFYSYKIDDLNLK